jgi:hypothetical protein
MTSRPLVVVGLLAGAACARQAPLPVLLTPQSRLGLGEGFGPGIVTATARTLTFQLAAAAHVIVLRVMDDGTIEQVQPLRGGDPLVHPGAHAVTASGARVAATSKGRIPPLGSAVFGPGSLSCVPILDPNLRAKPDPACAAQEAARAANMLQADPPPPSQVRDDEAGYWLLIVSDAPTAPGELEARLQQLDVDAGSLLGYVRQIPSALVGGRTTNWSAYYLGFAVLPPNASN